MKQTITTLLLSLISTGMMAQTATVSGPDGKLKVDFKIEGGKPTYTVSYDGKTVLDQSPLGLICDDADFSQGLTLKEQKSKADIPVNYTLNRCKTSHVDKKANSLDVTLTNSKKQSFTIQFRVEDNDVALRYAIPNQPSKQNDKTFSTRVMEEKTGFDFPHETSTFMCPQSDAMIGWKGTKPSYEEEYKFDEPMTTPSQYGHGYTFPCLFRIPDQKDNLWVLISETDVDSRYCGSHLSDMQQDGLYTIAFPMAEENSGNGTVEPAFALPGHTPWRTITVGSSLQPIVETTIPWDFVEPRYKTQNDYQFGKGVWSWIVWQDNSINWEDQCKYIDLAQKMGYKYILIDNWWDNNIGYDRMGDLVKYAQSQGIDVFLWWSSSGYWNDIEQGPINVMDNSISRKKAMRWMHSLGVKGIKVDFFGGDKQETMRLYEQILSDADDNDLMVIFHGCTIPRGWERMYPNYVGSEAVLASENIYFQQHFCDVEAQVTALHPFVRNTIGCMEFGGCFMNRHIHKGNQGGNTRRTTDVHELATCVLFQNPIQNFAITPENLGDNGEVEDYNAPGAPAPEICMDFLRQVPTTWDETRYIGGYPGKYVVLARRHGDTWYIAGNNATGGPLRLKFSLEMLAKGTQAQIYNDNMKTREPRLNSLKVTGKPISVNLADQGGFVIVGQ